MIINQHVKYLQFVISLLLVTGYTHMGNHGWLVQGTGTKHVFNNLSCIHEVRYNEPKMNNLAYLAGGMVSLEGETEQTVKHGEDCAPVEAVPDFGYHFIGWSDEVTDNPRTDTDVTDDISVTACFEINSYTLIYTAGKNGSLEGETEQTVKHGEDGAPVEAVPDLGYHFIGWSDGVTDNPRTDTDVTDDISVTAYFEINVYTLTYTAGENGSLEGETEQTVEHGSDGTPVEAIADEHYLFTHWSDGETANPRNDTQVSGDIDITAFFGPLINGPDTLCLEEWHVYSVQGSVYQSYEHIIWDIETTENEAQIIGPVNNKEVLVIAGDTPGSFELSVCIWSSDESATYCNKLLVYAYGHPPDRAWIQKKGSNMLLVNHTQPPYFDSFQWGKIDKGSFKIIQLENATRPYHYFDEPVNIYNYYYWVDTTVESNSCVRRSFYNNPDEYILDNPNMENTNPVKVYPLPAVNLLHVEWTSHAPDISEICIIAMDGNIVYRKSFRPIAMDNKITLDLKGIPDGVYILSLNTGKQRHIKKIMKQ